MGRVCSIEGCNEKHGALGYCRRHYKRFWKNGTTDIIRVTRPDVCMISECNKPVLARNLCRGHYYRLKKYGDPNLEYATIEKSPTFCKIPECSRVVEARGLCNIHYDRFMRSGDPIGSGNAIKGDKLKWIYSNLNYDEDKCLTWPYPPNSYGYGQVKYNGYNQHAHAVMCHLAHGPKPTPKHQAAHSCGNSACISRLHLRWATPLENGHDKILHGTSNKGTRNHSAVLNDSQVLDICTDNRSLGEIATTYNVSRQCIHRIKAGKSWSWLTGIKRDK